MLISKLSLSDSHSPSGSQIVVQLFQVKVSTWLTFSRFDTRYSSESPTTVTVRSFSGWMTLITESAQPAAPAVAKRRSSLSRRMVSPSTAESTW